MYSLQTLLELRAKRDWHIQQATHIDAIIDFGSSIDEVPSLTTTQDKVSNEVEMPYNHGASYQEKFASIIKIKGRFLNINEIACVVNQYEPSIPIETAKKSLGSAKNLLLNDNVIIKYKIDNNNSNSFYGSPDWLDETGKPKPEYMYDEKSVKSKKKISI